MTTKFVGTQNGETLELDPEVERCFRGHRGSVNSICFNPSMKQICSGSSDKIVMVWNFAPQIRAFKFFGHKGAVMTVDYSTSGKLIASGSKDCSIRIWEAKVLSYLKFV